MYRFTLAHEILIIFLLNKISVVSILTGYNFTTDKSYEREKEELVKKYEEQVQFLRQQLHNLEDKMESEREALTKKFQDDRAGLEEELACAIREELKVRSKDQRS